MSGYYWGFSTLYALSVIAGILAVIMLYLSPTEYIMSAIDASIVTVLVAVMVFIGGFVMAKPTKKK